jgi:hypothetical protein
MRKRPLRALDEDGSAHDPRLLLLRMGSDWRGPDEGREGECEARGARRPPVASCPVTLPNVCARGERNQFTLGHWLSSDRDGKASSGEHHT